MTNRSFYYSLPNHSGLNAGSLAGDVFANNAWMGFFEIVAHCVAPLIMDMKYFGRRGALSLMFFIGGISCLGSLLFKNLSRCATDEVTLCDEVSQVNSATVMSMTTIRCRRHEPSPIAVIYLDVSGEFKSDKQFSLI